MAETCIPPRANLVLSDRAPVPTARPSLVVTARNLKPMKLNSDQPAG